MSRVYELPTHLQVEDDLIAGLSARQLVRLAVGAALAYGLWDQAQWLPEGVRLSLSVAVAVVGVLCAVVQPKGRPIDQWTLAAARFAMQPRQLTWRVSGQLALGVQESAGWAELAPRPDWLDRDDVKACLVPLERTER